MSLRSSHVAPQGTAAPRWCALRPVSAPKVTSEIAMAKSHKTENSPRTCRANTVETTIVVTNAMAP